ncbi:MULTISPECIES: hypothetical protein [unclassified Gilliamella]|uniref:hypothetical protein n=1 Tax=unclassified Gilliamella TaxID=2685620 RepID=UPI00226A050B|nr:MULTISPECIES: hypothetical protein [unclassified Gilliamella]MCX8669927.1 hypothetical protein [Gilliamella sp. B2785]
MVFFLPFSGHALTSQTTANQIQGTPPYLTFDGGRTRAVDTNGLLGITLSDGTQYTPSTNSSSYSRPIVLPVEGQTLADIRMFVPTDTNSVDLSTLIGPPYNYWGDDDGDSDINATGSLSLLILDRFNQAVSRNSVLMTCNSPYSITLSSTNGTLYTRYGVPNRIDFSARNAYYHVIPKTTPVLCFVRPASFSGIDGPSSMWNPRGGFIPQSTDPSHYGLNFPTTGANGLYFELDIRGSLQPLSWSSSPVSQGGITVTMSNPTATRVRVTLTGPYATTSQHNSDNPGRVSTPSLPQTFELVGRDRQGNPVVKYGFTLKQWFVHRGDKADTYPNTLSWCNSIGYRMPRVKDLTNAVHTYPGVVVPSATPSSPGNEFMRHIGSGFFSEWGVMSYYRVGFISHWHWTSDPYVYGNAQDTNFVVQTNSGHVNGYSYPYPHPGLCAYP